MMTTAHNILELHLKAYDEALAQAESMLNKNLISEKLCTYCFVAIQENRISIDKKLWISELEGRTEAELREIMSKFQSLSQPQNENAIDSILWPILEQKKVIHHYLKNRSSEEGLALQVLVESFPLVSFRTEIMNEVLNF